ncbi:unnamed protein product [Aureobasidium pullulans]|nr:unnamed protein product [Aureobasidium pullulans]
MIQVQGAFELSSQLFDLGCTIPTSHLNIKGTPIRILETGEFYKEINAQIDQAFDNCELNLRHAGGQGWSQVVRVNSYHVPINNEALDAMVRNFKKWMPNHQPIWTCVGVPRLGEDDMRVEIEVVAVDEDGKPIATQK